MGKEAHLVGVVAGLGAAAVKGAFVNNKNTAAPEIFVIKDINQAEQGRWRIEWALKEMPVMRSLMERFSKERPLEGVKMSGCLHITTETANLARALKMTAADSMLTASNPLSTQVDTAAAPVSVYERPVFAI